MSRQLPYYIVLALFVVCFLILNWIYGYVIVVQSQTTDCFFMFGREFATGFLNRPAGLLTYAGRFFGQFYHHQWLGALIVSGWITCFGFVFHRLLVKLQETPRVLMTLFPCALLLALHTSTICMIQDTLGLSVSCCAFWGYVCLGRKLTRRIYALTATPLLYLALGVYFWVFVAWVVVFEWLDGPPRSGVVFKIAYVVFSVAIPLAGWRWLFLIPLQSAVRWPLMFVAPCRGGVLYSDFTNLVIDCVLAVILSVSLLLIPFWERLPLGARRSLFWRVNRPKRYGVVSAIALSVLAVLLGVVRYDVPMATMICYRQLYRDKQWDALLEKARQRPTASLEVQFMTNFALQQKGRLLDEMFNYPQAWGPRGLVFSFSSKEDQEQVVDDSYRAMYNSDLFYEMGHVNLAFRHTYASMILIGETDAILKRMVQCSMANGNHEMAEKYIRRLERTLFERDFARRLRAMMSDPRAEEEEFGEIRRRMPTVDIAISKHPLQQVAVLLSNEDNLMALNYLTAWLLLDKQRGSIATIVDNVGHFKRTGYVSIPAHCQEVLLLWERQERVSVDLQGFGYDRKITARVDEFLRDLAQNQDRPDSLQHLKQGYGDTYMYYCFCVGTPEEIQRLMPRGANSVGAIRQE